MDAFQAGCRSTWTGGQDQPTAGTMGHVASANQIRFLKLRFFVPMSLLLPGTMFFYVFLLFGDNTRHAGLMVGQYQVRWYYKQTDMLD